MIVKLGGVPHKVGYNWKGAALWIAQGVALLVCAGWMR